MKEILRGFCIVFLCFVAVFVSMAFNKITVSRLRFRVESIEVRLQEIEERLPAQPAPALMEHDAR